MKLSVFDRILLFLSMLFMLAIGIGIAVVCTSAITFVEMARYLEIYLTGTQGLLILVAVAAVVILVAVKLIIALFTSSGEKSNTVDSGEKIVLKSNDDGNIMVSSDLVKDIAVRYAKNSDDVKDVDCKILKEENGVKILMKFYLKRDVVINEFLSSTQSQLKDYVEKHSGINILSVDLCADVISNNGNTSTARVK